MFNQIPYMMASPMYQAAAPLASGLSSLSNPASLATAGTKAAGLIGKINWSSILSNAGKALNVANQAIPLYYQVKPVFNNIKALGRIGKEFTKMGDKNATNNIRNDVNTINDNSLNNQDATTGEKTNIPIPTFFL